MVGWAITFKRLSSTASKAGVLENEGVVALGRGEERRGEEGESHKRDDTLLTYFFLPQEV